MDTTKYSYRVVNTQTGGLCSEHKTEAAAKRMVGRLVAMSNGKLTRAAFRVEPITK